MKAQIDTLDTNEHIQIYNIIKKYNINLSETTNGVFVSSEHLTEECFVEINKHIQFCKDQRIRIEEEILQRKNYEKLSNYN